MAELGLVTSAFSVISLAIQLGDSLRIACEFWESVEDGPDDIKRLSLELRLLANILYQIQRHHEMGDGDRVEEQMIRDALTLAKRDIDELAKIVTDLSRVIRPDQKSLRRKWGLIQIVLKGGKILKLKGYIESAKSILTLLQTTRALSTTMQLNGKLDIFTANFLPVTQEPPAIEVKPAVIETETMTTNSVSRIVLKDDWGVRLHKKTTETSLNAILFKLNLRSTSSRVIENGGNINDDDNDNYADDDSSMIYTPQKTYVVNLAWKFLSCRKGFRLTTNNNFDTWSFNTIRTRNSGSTVFSLCSSGDLAGIRRLLISGEASLCDVDATGLTLLHYACYKGHSELVRFLIRNGADSYQQDDRGETAINALAEFDYFQGTYSQHLVAEIMDTIIQEGSFDPMDWHNPILNHKTCTLYYGLPYENLRILFGKEFYASSRERYDCIVDNMLGITQFGENGLDCINFLLTQYASLRYDEETCQEWPYEETLLQILISHWLIATGYRQSEWETKISRALALTPDLYWVEEAGTTLDAIANVHGNPLPSWLRLLSRSGIDLQEYVLYEHSKHPEGLIQIWEPCCRLIHVQFVCSSGDGASNANIVLNNVCDPSYEHLDPEYRCDAYYPMENCISQRDPIFVAEDGKPIPPLPGSWAPSLRPKRELDLIISRGKNSWIYVDCLKSGDILWRGRIPWWVREGGPGRKDESTEEKGTSEKCNEKGNVDENEDGNRLVNEDPVRSCPSSENVGKDSMT